MFFEKGGKEGGREGREKGKDARGVFLFSILFLGEFPPLVERRM